MKINPRAKDLVNACLRFFQGRPWQRFHDDDPIIMKLPEGRGGPFVLSILGGAGREFGLQIIDGASGLDDFFAMLNRGDGETLVPRPSKRFSITRSHTTRLPDPFRKILTAAGYTGKDVPWIMAIDPDSSTGRPVRNSEMRQLCHILNAFLAAWSQGLQQRPPGNDWLIAGLEVSGGLQRPRVTVDWTKIPTEDRPGLPASAPIDQNMPVPEPGDLKGWKTLDIALSEEIAKASVKRGLNDKKALQRYFGHPRICTPDTAEGVREMRTMAYCEWFAYRYRSRRGAPTIAESMLRSGLHPAQQALLEARSATTPGIYRIDNVVHSEYLDLVDIDSGRSSRIHDRLLSQSAVVGCFMPLRIYQVQDFHFCSLAGPAMSPLQANSLLRFFESVSLHLDDPNLTAKEHLLGRLWDFLVDYNPMQTLTLQNTDGEPLSGHSVEFAVANPKALRTHLDNVTT